MIKPEQIPDEVIDAAVAMRDRGGSMRDIIRTALNAWPGTGHCHRDEQIARLRAEVEKLGRDYNTVHDAHDDWVRESERLRVEVKKMRADIAYADKHASKVEGLLWGTAKENEKLRAALEEIIAFKVFGFAITAPNGEDVYCEGTNRFVREESMIKVRKIARAALSGDKHE